MAIISGSIDFTNFNIKEIALGIAVIIAIAAAVFWLIQWLKESRDTDKIYRFLLKSSKERGWAFRTARVIASNTGIPIESVSKLCGRDKRVRRNEKEKESWRIK